MHRAYLRSTPNDDQRPEPLAAAVLARASHARMDEIKAWLKPRLPTLEEPEIIFALTSSMKLGGADGFRTSVHLKDKFNWPVDMELCCFARDTCNALAFALKVETREWVVRTGLRFPGKDEHTIEWDDHVERRHAGRIVSIDPSYAAAIVQPFDGLLKAGQPRRVFAEQVVANTTTGEYAIHKIGLAANEASA